MSIDTSIDCDASGLYRRKIDLHAPDPSTVVGWMEDDFHHFGLKLVHDGCVVKSIEASSPRHPWTTCPGGLMEIRMLEGQALFQRASDIGQLIDMRQQCTHLFDLAGLAVAHAARGLTRRRFEIEMPGREVTARDSTGLFALAFGPTVISLTRDGVHAMTWEIDADMITGPEPYAGHSMQTGFRLWTESMPLDEAECANILRRSVMVGSSRKQSMSHIANATQMNMPGACFTFQPLQISKAVFHPSSRQDFTHRPGDMLKNIANGYPHET